MGELQLIDVVEDRVEKVEAVVVEVERIVVSVEVGVEVDEVEVDGVEVDEVELARVVTVPKGLTGQSVSLKVTFKRSGEGVAFSR